MTPVLYVHGFASSPGSAKIQSLRTMLDPSGIVLETPDLNLPSFEQLDFDAIVDRVIAIERSLHPRAIVGSSLGGLIALDRFLHFAFCILHSDFLIRARASRS